MPSFIIVVYVWQILEKEGPFCPSHVCEQPQKDPSWIGLNHLQMSLELSWLIVPTFFFLSSSFNDQKLGRVICFWFLAFFWREERNNFYFLFWKYIFIILFYKLKVMNQDMVILFQCHHFSNHSRNYKTSLKQNWSTIASTSYIYCNSRPTI